MATLPTQERPFLHFCPRFTYARIQWQRSMLKPATKQTQPNNKNPRISHTATPDCFAIQISTSHVYIFHRCCSHFLEWSWGWNVMRFLDLLQMFSKQWKFYQCGSHCLMCKRCMCCLILHSIPVSWLDSLSGHLLTAEFATYTETK